MLGANPACVINVRDGPASLQGMRRRSPRPFKEFRLEDRFFFRESHPRTQEADGEGIP